MILCLVRFILLLTGISQIGHNKPFIYEKRGFSSIEEHDTEILKRCNSIVGLDDKLQILGDLALGDEKEWDRVYYNLTCKNVHFIIGNHDTNNRIDRYAFEYNFISHGYAEIFKHSKRRTFYLSHYPTLVGNYEDGRPAMWNLSGHTHFKEKFSEYPNIYNVAVDAHDCYPVSIETIMHDILKKEGKI